MSLNGRVVRGVLALTVAGVAACGGGRGAQDRAACEPSTGELGAEATAAALVGSYSLTLVATAGAAAGDTVVGTLELQPYSPEMQQLPGPGGAAHPDFVAPLFGTADIDLDAVGARTPGRLGSADPNMPGVMVIEGTGVPQSIILRFGSDANHRDQQAFEGTYTVLDVREISDGGFRGSWRSGLTTTEAQGFFCAVAGGG